MANRQIKRFSTLLNHQQNANQKQRYPVKLVRIGTIKKIKNLSVGKDVKKLDPLYIGGENIK